VVPSDTNSIAKVLAVVVPVARVPVVKNPVPKVIVYDVTPLVTMITEALDPAGATVVVKVAVAFGVTFTTALVAKAMATVPAVCAAYPPATCCVALMLPDRKFFGLSGRTDSNVAKEIVWCSAVGIEVISCSAAG